MNGTETARKSDFLYVDPETGALARTIAKRWGTNLKNVVAAAVLTFAQMSTTDQGNALRGEPTQPEPASAEPISDFFSTPRGTPEPSVMRVGAVSHESGMVKVLASDGSSFCAAPNAIDEIHEDDDANGVHITIGPNVYHAAATSQQVLDAMVEARAYRNE